ncbi:hypothetical protein SPRG_16428 [Saprolegnia parasitica CBS 223.65]|uniref:VOC domain-containing protein n=1 Tax=Saprolegnia parasitica (strain CBS 223.65) TaxID=695850 RepID=A0A067BUV9_SAPPC|nr:hypothetical protein SPRG_16428 [Saprolegnia parasitica CBS 223.65]KDO18066.1 hypothetical protein SPRG_16428 [Saprolegnia parasitica CBS 223.65]|eukprot:XP_012211233.1 hypothetical protein SPRG_16428 [Saprolegnia parasitica CBS 223.65]
MMLLVQRLTTTATTRRAAMVRGLATVAPFHLAVPVHSLAEAQAFYGGKLGFTEGRSSAHWQDYNMLGHQLVIHAVGPEYRGRDYHNPVDMDDVPVPHFGVCLTVDEFHALAQRVQAAAIPFVVQPHLRFEGRPGEQWTMFFKDPSNNNLEFKAMTNPANLFAKYVEK